ncbi:KRAB-A domain-containing protein 2-like isoform X1 [Penaeus monodon]|uniref:KRAB-A domain-containing protein 2-like isoform X1 n=1 Tax=Penaeus monodon TaxID=6687 RepID=UPI0018A7D7D1|nr:KRAB-A domain-containing protein 2-like isoform X1 [Penaeus monodon]XP_037788342.1 KRAB-A domain-containing protein 2-like isoform X1 [Penaeus monodon]
MQPLPQVQFKWIMVDQCHSTKFVILRALTSKRTAEVAFQLLDTHSFCLELLSYCKTKNGFEFTAKVISELKELWPQLIMVHGKPRHPQSQGSVERANGDIKDWSSGLRFVQHQKNCSSFRYQAHSIQSIVWR